MKRFAMILLSLILCFGFAGCGTGAGGDGTVVLTVWEDETNIDMLEKLAKEFTADYKKTYPNAPTVQIQFTPQVEKSAVENLHQYGPSGSGPDVLAFVHDAMGVAVNNGDVAPVLFDSKIRQEHTEEAVGAFSIDDKLYAYPITAESITVMYDKTKLSPEDLASFEALKASGKKIAMKVNADAYYTFALLTDANLFGEDGTDKNTLDLDATQAVNNVTSFFKDNFECITPIDEPENALPLLQNGTVAGIVCSPFLWDTVKKALGANAAAAPMPTLNGVTLKPFSGYKGYAVSSYTKYPHLSQAFASFMVSETAQLYRFVNRQLLPTLKDTSKMDEAMNKDTTGKYDSVQAFKASLAASRVMPNILAMGNVWSPLQDAVTYCYNNRASITSAVVKEKLQDAENKILAKN